MGKKVGNWEGSRETQTDAPRVRLSRLKGESKEKERKVGEEWRAQDRNIVVVGSFSFLS